MFIYNTYLTDRKITKYLTKFKHFKSAAEVFNDLVPWHKKPTENYELFLSRLVLLAGKGKILAVPLGKHLMISRPIINKSNNILAGHMSADKFLLISSAGNYDYR